MRIRRLSLEQFRSYRKTAMEFADDEQIHLFLGPNGSGKTNILEAIALLSLSKSVFGLEEDDLRQWGSDFYRVTGSVCSDAGQEDELEVVSQSLPRTAKACLRNGVRTPASSFVGLLPVVPFFPQDLALFSGPPADRRRFLDQLLSQVSPEYLQSLLQYNRLLKQRNSLLKRIADGMASPDELDTWDAGLAEQGSRLLQLRRELAETFNLTLPQEVTALGERWKEVSMLYHTPCESHDVEGLRTELLQALRDVRDRDVLIQATTVGPHRDDWTVLADGRPLMSFASRGQQRVAVLALLFLEASYLEIRRGEKPVVLLDDIFSELDAEHRERVLQAFAGHQVFITATDLPTEGEFPGKVKVMGKEVRSA